jgi:hypothetical protein
MITEPKNFRPGGCGLPGCVFKINIYDVYASLAADREFSIAEWFEMEVLASG